MKTNSLDKLAEQWIGQAESDVSSTLQDDRLEGQKYFFGEKFGNERDGLSDYNSRDTFDVVQDSTAFFCETFLLGDDVVFFAPADGADVDRAKLRTRYVNRVVEEENNRFTLLHDTVQTAFKDKNCVAKAYVEERDRKEVKEVKGISPLAYAELEALESAGAISIDKADELDDGTINAEVSQTVTDKKLKIEVLPPERFIIDPDATSINDARCVGEWMEVTRSDLLEMGFDADLVKTLSDEEVAQEIEEQAREGHADSGSEIGDESQHKLKLYELYFYSDQDGDGIAELHQVFYCCKKVLESEVVERHGYFGWAAVRIAHRWEGMSAYDLVGDIQKLKSTIQRQIADNLVRSNNQSVIADPKAFLNPSALVDNPVGAVHWTTNMQNRDVRSLVADLPAPQLSSMTMPALEMLEQAKESRSGKTRLSVGMNQDVISQQNSTSLIDNQTSATMRRLMMAARSYAETFLIPLMREIYQLAIDHELPGVMEEVDGQWVNLSPAELGASTSMKVHPALTADEKQSRARFLLAMHNTLAPPGMPAHPLYQQANQYAVLREIFDLSGQMSPEFLTNPGNEQYQELQGQVQQAAQQMQAMQQTIQQLQMALGDKGQKEQAELMLKKEKQDRDYELGNRKQALAEDAEAHDQVMDESELVLERQQGRPVSV